MVDEQLGLERGVELLQQAIGHRRAGKAELAHRNSHSVLAKRR